MNKHQIPDSAKAICGLLAFIVTQTWASACGLRWTEPKSHFDGVDFQGRVHLIEKLGSLDAGDAKLPIFLIFNSGNNQISPYVGSGFRLPLLESRMVAVDPNTFKFEQPDGWFQIFWRDKKNPSILHGSAGGWTAEIKGDIITAWADCGAKVIFSKGRITQMQLKDRTFEYIYSGSKVTEIRENGAAVLRVLTNANTGESTGLSLGMRGDISWDLGEKPRVQSIAEQNVISGMERAVTQVKSVDGRCETFQFEVDDQMRPSVKVGGVRTLIWDSSLKHIVKDGEWSYEIKPDEDDQFANAAIGRTNEKGQKEFWHYSQAKGEEVSITLDGKRILKRWFTSGILTGKPHITKISTVNPGGGFKNQPELTRKEKYISSKAFFYDEQGRTIRVKDDASDTLSTFDYKSDGTLVESSIFRGSPAAIKVIVDGNITNMLGKVGDLISIEKPNK